MKMNNGVTAWAISLSNYVNEAVKNCEKWIQENMPEHKHSCRASNPFPTDYYPDLDTTAEFDEEQATYYQSQIDILHWIVELGRIDIATEVSLLGSHVTLPRKGHLQTVFHIYAYLMKRHNSRLAVDPSYPEIDMRVFHHKDWTDFFGDVEEAIPDNAPEPRRKPIILRAFVDSDHANDKVRQRSCTGFCFFINMDLVYKETGNCSSFWFRICCSKTSHGSFMRIEIQTQDDGSTHGRTYPYVWRQHVNHSQHSMP